MKQTLRAERFSWFKFMTLLEGILQNRDMEDMNSRDNCTNI